jgi:hypothetical protein
MRPLKNVQFCSSPRRAIRLRRINHRHTLSILRIELKLHFVQNVEPDAGIGQKGAFFKGFKICAKLHPMNDPPVVVSLSYP